MILAGDVGATKTLLGLFVERRGRLQSLREASYPSAASRSLESIVLTFLAEGRERPTRAAIGVAGPILNGKSHVVNLAWPVDSRRLARALRIATVGLLNDLEATAWGIGELDPRWIASLTPGIRPRPGNAALIAAGSGLGTAILFWDGKRHHPAAAEGGHQGFAPRDEMEIGLLREGIRRHGRLSLDRIVCGSGLSEIYRFLAGARPGARHGFPGGSPSGDPNAAIAEAGLRGLDPLAERALDRFASLYGAAAGDLALVAGAVGGVYLAGGIAPKILPKLREGAFLEAFRSKGRLTRYMERIPVRVVLEPRTALLGAAARAARAYPKPLFTAPSPRSR
jgi:glucokinase